MAADFIDRRRRLDSDSDSEAMSTEGEQYADSGRSSALAGEEEAISTNKFAAFLSCAKPAGKVTFGKPFSRPLRTAPVPRLNPYAKEFVTCTQVPLHARTIYRKRN